jgi:hypothetical protein
VLWDKGIAFKSGVPFISFQYFLQLVFFPPLPTYKLKPNEPFSNIHSHQHWRVMEGKPKTSSYISKPMHMNEMFYRATKMDI